MSQIRNKMVLVVVLLGLTACSAIQPEATLDANLLATSVSGTLTAVPPRTLPPQPSDTALPASPTVPPTEATATATATELPAPTLSPSSTVSPSNTPQTTQTAGPTSTLVASDIRSTLGNPTWRDTLSGGNNWSTGEDSFTRLQVEDGELHLTGLTTTDGWRLTWPVVRDLYLEMTARTGSCTGNDHYGLMARVPDRTAANRGYLFGFTCDGRYSLRAWDGPEETMTQIVNLTSSSAIVSGSQQENRMGLWISGETIRLYANGTLLTQLEDDRFTAEGSFGIFVGARQTENFTVHVDEVAYWADP